MDIKKIILNVLGKMKNDKRISESAYEKLGNNVERMESTPQTSIVQIDPNAIFLNELRSNKYVLRVFDKYNNMSEVIGLLIDEGSLRGKFYFVKAVYAFNTELSREKIEQDYSLAIKIARMATQWKRGASKYFPNLKLSTQSCLLPEHKNMDGIIRSFEDDFWDIYFPPNGDGCLCWVKSSDEEIADLPVSLPKVPEYYKFNAGK